jgi:signal peptidase I
MEHFETEIIPDPEPNLPEENKGGSVRRFIIDVLETVVLSLVLFLGINAISARIRIESISMQPTLYAGDYVIVNKMAYKLGEPSRGDVVVFHYPPDPGREPYIKRVVGLPGDHVVVRDNQVLVNGVALDEPYINSAPNYQGEWLVPEDSLFVLGDNRNNSSDSHSWGMVPLENVIGKAEVVYWPPSEWKVLDPSSAVAADR